MIDWMWRVLGLAAGLAWLSYVLGAALRWLRGKEWH